MMKVICGRCRGWYRLPGGGKCQSCDDGFLPYEGESEPSFHDLAVLQRENEELRLKLAEERQKNLILLATLL